VDVAPLEHLAGYRIEEELGRGGMGVVYRATDLSLDRCVAVKVIVPRFAGDAVFRERFLRESRVAASLEHPNVVPIYEAREQDTHLYMAMRYVAGRDLKAVLAAGGPLEPERALAICRQVASALDAAAAKGLVHRDVKPGNVLLDEDDRAYLVDFGVAKHATAATTLTARDGIVGTLDYLAPEQIRGERLDGRADQYALACLLWECLTGTPPFRRATEVETLWAHMQDEPPALVAVPALERVLHKGLAKDASGRYETCRELVAAATVAFGSGRRPRLSRRHAGLLLVVAGLLLAGASVAALWRSSNERSGARQSLAIDASEASMASIDPTSGAVRAVLPLVGRPTGAAAAHGLIWVATIDSSAVTAIDVAKRRIARAVALPFRPAAVAVGEGAVWVANARRGEVVGVREGYDEVFAPIRFRRGPPPRQDAVLAATAIAAGSGAVWVTDGSARVARVDPRSRRVTKISTHRPVSGVTVAVGAVWAISTRPPGVLRIEPSRGVVTDRIQIDARSGEDVPFPVAITASAHAIWVLNANTATVTRVDPRARSIVGTTSIGVDRIPNAIAAGRGRVWVAGEDGTLTSIDEATGATRSQQVGAPLREVAVAEERVWVGTVAIDQALPGGVE